MTSTTTQQSLFQHALLHEQPLPAGLIEPGVQAQFDVYRNAYRARLRAALRDNYEVLPRVMGDDAFDALADAYINAHPSRNYSLRWFGHQLGAFMAAHDALLPHPALHDLALMEWALGSAFDAAQPPLLDPAELSALPGADWPDLRLALHPGVQVLALNWAVGPIWHALKAGQEDMPAPDALAHHQLIWRDGLKPQWKSLSGAELIFVQGLQAGHTFGQLCEALADAVGEEQAAQTAVTILTELLSSGALCRGSTALTEPAPAT
jgi:hypothetical protein